MARKRSGLGARVAMHWAPLCRRTGVRFQAPQTKSAWQWLRWVVPELKGSKVMSKALQLRKELLTVLGSSLWSSQQLQNGSKMRFLRCGWAVLGVAELTRLPWDSGSDLRSDPVWFTPGVPGCCCCSSCEARAGLLVVPSPWPCVGLGSSAGACRSGTRAVRLSRCSLC